MIRGISDDILRRVYDFSEMTNEELRCKFFQKLQECIELCNNTSDILDWLKNEGLEKEVKDLLNIWLEDGTLENLINIDKLNKKLDTETFNNAITTINEQLDTKANKTELNNGWNNNVESGTITLIFDDFYQSWYDNVYTPILLPNSIPHGIAFCGAELSQNNTGFVNETTALACFNNKFIEPLFHANSHSTFDDNLSQTKFDILITNNGLDYWKNKKLNSWGIVIPNSQLSEKWIPQLKQYFNYAFARKPSEQFGNVVDKSKSNFYINRFSLDGVSNFNDSRLQDCLNKVKNEKSWGVIYGHRFSETNYCPASVVQDIVTWANANNIQILKPTEAYNKHNTLGISKKIFEESKNCYLKDTLSSTSITQIDTDINLGYVGGSNREIENITFEGGVATININGIYEINLRQLIAKTGGATNGNIKIKLYINDVLSDTLIFPLIYGDGVLQNIYYHFTKKFKSGDKIKFSYNASTQPLNCGQSGSLLQIVKIN